jgi:HSP20 family protein
MIFIVCKENNFIKKFKTMLAIRRTTPSVKLFTDIFDDLFQFPELEMSSANPIYDIVENEKEFVVEMHLSGIKKEDVKLDINENVLTIKAERKEVKDLKYNRKESFTGIYQRSFTLPETANKEKIDALLEDGILKINIPKIEEVTKLSKRTIEIK